MTIVIDAAEILSIPSYKKLIRKKKKKIQRERDRRERERERERELLVSLSLQLFFFLFHILLSEANNYHQSFIRACPYVLL